MKSTKFNIEDIVCIVDDPETEKKGIGFLSGYLNSKELNELSKIKQHNIKYVGEKTIQNNEKIYFIEVKGLSIELINKLLIDSTKLLIEEKDGLYTPIEAFKWIIDFFLKYDFKSEAKKKIIGDIGELLFIYQVNKIFNINISSYIRKEEGVYDFYVYGKPIEVKTTNDSKSEIIISLDQIKTIKEKDIVIVNFKVVEEKTNILELFDKIDVSSSSLLMEMKKHYIDMYEDFPDVINRYTVDLNSVDFYLFKNELLPNISISNDSAVSKVLCHISTTKNNCKNFETIKNTLKDLINN